MLEIRERSGAATSALELIDDLNVLAYGTCPEENIRTLERLHNIERRGFFGAAPPLL